MYENYIIIKGFPSILWFLFKREHTFELHGGKDCMFNKKKKEKTNKS